MSVTCIKMVVVQFFQTLLIILLLSFVSSLSSRCWLSRLFLSCKQRNNKESSNDVKDISETIPSGVSKEFDRLVTLVENVYTVKNANQNDEDFLNSEISKAIDNASQPENLAKAAQIMLSMVALNGLMLKNSIRLDTLKFEKVTTIANALAQYVIPVLDDQLVKEYKRLVSTGETPIKAMHSALESVTDDSNLEKMGIGSPLKEEYLGCEFDDTKYTYDKNQRKWNVSYFFPKIILDRIRDYGEVWTRLDFMYDVCKKTITETIKYDDVWQLLR